MIEIDFNDLDTGFMIGRAAAMADWAFKKEQREFETLIANLRAANWRREHLERSRAIQKKYRSTPKAKARAKQLDREDPERRRAKQRKYKASNKGKTRAEKWRRDHLEQIRQHQKKYRDKPATKKRANERTAKQRREARSLEVLTCFECGGQYTRTPGRRTSQFCRVACRRRFRYRERANP